MPIIVLDAPRPMVALDVRLPCGLGWRLVLARLLSSLIVACTGGVVSAAVLELDVHEWEAL